MVTLTSEIRANNPPYTLPADHDLQTLNPDKPFRPRGPDNRFALTLGNQPTTVAGDSVIQQISGARGIEEPWSDLPLYGYYWMHPQVHWLLWVHAFCYGSRPTDLGPEHMRGVIR